MQKNLTKLLFILIGLCAFVLGMKQLREPDIWWQLLSGRWMLDNAAITHKDIFSFTMAGKPWINVKWLYEILIALIEKGLGPEGVILLQATINVAIVWLLYRTLSAFTKYNHKTVTAFSSAISLLVFLAIDEYRMAGRPEMISHLMCTVFLYLLWQNPGLDWKKVAWLVPLQCIWANMHEGYPVGIVIIGTIAIGGFASYVVTKEKSSLQYAMRALLLLGACILIILLNPNGIVLWKQPFEIYRQVWANKYTTELYSYRDAQYWTIQAKWHIAVLVLVAVYWITQVVQAIRQQQAKVFFSPLRSAYLVLIPLFAYLSLTANRNIPFSQIVLFPSIPVILIWLFEISKIERLSIYKALASKALYIGIAAAVLFYGVIVSNRFYKYTNSVNKYGIHVSMLHNPTGAAAFIKQYKLKGPVFSDYFISSYLLWDLYPSFKSYIDLRDLDVFPVKFFDDYFSIYENPKRFGELDKKYNFNYVVISVSQLQALQMNLYWEDGYNLMYIDPVSAVFLKQNETNAPLNGDYGLQKMYNWPAPIEDPAWAEGLNKLLNPSIAYPDEDESRQAIHAARYYNLIKNYSASVKMLLPQMAAYEEDAEAYATMGTTYRQYADVLSDPIEKKQKMDSAANFLQHALELSPGYAPALSSLGVMYIMQGNYKDAGETLEQFLAQDKSDDYMYFLYGFSNRMMWKSTGETDYCHKVIKAMNSSVRLNPRNGKAYLYMAESYLALDDKDNARVYMQKAIGSGNKWVKEEEDVLSELKKQLGTK